MIVPGGCCVGIADHRIKRHLESDLYLSLIASHHTYRCSQSAPGTLPADHFPGSDPIFSLMACGAISLSATGRSAPPSLDIWSRMVLGWVTPVMAEGGEYTIPDSKKTDTVLWIPTGRVPSGITLSFAFSGNLSTIDITLLENQCVKLRGYGGWPPVLSFRDYPEYRYEGPGL